MLDLVQDGVALVERELASLLEEFERPAVLSEAMRYAVLPGGKRVRPRICLASALAVGGRVEDAVFPACAIELLHSYTLIHDDLPSMDNDSERRGRPSVWAKFGEANAILAGDALQALAFKAVVRAPRRSGLVAVLGEAAVGVVRGQTAELSGDGDTDFIYRHKTADLFMAAAAMGSIVGGGTQDDTERLRAYARELGFAFQHVDDLLDGNSPYSLDETRLRIDERTEAARVLLRDLPGDVTPLDELAEWLSER